MRTPAVWSSYMNAGSGPASMKEETAVIGLKYDNGRKTGSGQASRSGSNLEVETELSF